jgi:hypothetical protein
MIAITSGREFNSRFLNHDFSMPMRDSKLFFVREQGWPRALWGHPNCVSAKFTVRTKFVFQGDLCRVLEEQAPYGRNEENASQIQIYM